METYTVGGSIISEFVEEFNYDIFYLYKIRNRDSKKVSELNIKINAEKEAVARDFPEKKQFTQTLEEQLSYCNRFSDEWQRRVAPLFDELYKMTKNIGIYALPIEYFTG